LRGEGGVILDEQGITQWEQDCRNALNQNEITPNPEKYSFTLNFSSLGSMATRDIVARAIDHELNISGDDYVLLITEHLDKQELQTRFPSINNFLLKHGIKLGIDPIPVVPAAHYFVGGISVNKIGQVVNSTTGNIISGLYAIGEVACTGMHGANRLASNSLLEAVVYSSRASLNLTDNVRVPFDNSNVLPDWRADGLESLVDHYSLVDDLKSLKMTMSRDVGVVRSNRRLNRALRRVNLIENEVELAWESSIPTRPLIELRNMVQISKIIIESALKRKENLGLHYNEDNLS